MEVEESNMLLCYRRVRERRSMSIIQLLRPIWRSRAARVSFTSYLGCRTPVLQRHPY